MTAINSRSIEPVGTRSYGTRGSQATGADPWVAIHPTAWKGDSPKFVQHQFLEVHMQDATYPRYYDTRPGPADLRTQWGTPPEGPPFPSRLVSKHIPSAKKTSTCGIFAGCSKRYRALEFRCCAGLACSPSKAARLFCCPRPGPVQ